MKYNFYISLVTQYENLGDYLIAQATIDILKEFGDITLYIKDVPQNYINLFNLPNNTKFVKESFLITILKNRKESWVYIKKPGGYATSNNLKYKITLFLKILYLFTSKQLFKIKFVKMPHSFSGELNTLEKMYHKLYDINMIRDKLSLKNYNNSYISNSFLVEDLAVYYMNKNSKFLSNINVERNKISISLRFDRLENESEISNNIAKYLLEKNNLDEIIYISQVTLDNNLNSKVSKYYNRNHISYNISNNSINEIIDIYKSSKYIISNRLHSLLLARINGAIPIALIDIEKDKKIVGTLDLLNIKWFDKNTLEKNILKLVINDSLIINNINIENKIKNIFTDDFLN